MRKAPEIKYWLYLIKSSLHIIHTAFLIKRFHLSLPCNTSLQETQNHSRLNTACQYLLFDEARHPPRSLLFYSFFSILSLKI